MVSGPSESSLSSASRQRSAQGALAQPQDDPTSYISAEGGIAEVVLVTLETSHREQTNRQHSSRASVSVPYYVSPDDGL